MSKTTSDHTMTASTNLLPGLPGPSDLTPQGASPMQKVHENLRGRYAWATLFGFAGAMAGAIAGYMLVIPLFTSTGAVLIKPSIRTVLYPLKEHDAPRMFDEYVDAQVATMSSPRVLTMAMQDEQWKTLKRGLTTESTEQFMDSLVIERGKRSHVIHLAFTDTDAKASADGVAVVIRAYRNIADDVEDQSGIETQRTLGIIKSRLNKDLQDLQDRVYEVDPIYSPAALRKMWSFKLEEARQISESIKETQIALVTFGAATLGGKAEGEEEDVVPLNLPIEQIATRDSHMRLLMTKRQSIETQLISYSQSLGSSHKTVKRLMAMLADGTRAIMDYKVEYESNPTLASALTTSSSRGLTQSVPELKARQKVLLELQEKTREEMTTMSQRLRRIDAYEQRIASKEKKLSLVEQRIEEIETEMGPNVDGRVEVISSGLTEPDPSNDGTRKQVAVAGFGAGGIVGVSIVILIGLLDRRIRNSDDARNRASDVKMLGVLPSLPKDLADPDHAAIAGYCVHYIRTLLQLGSAAGDKKVIAVTSPAEGSGKTSLTLALGLSFAASGSRTLLIDCDLGRGGLTSRLNAIIRRRVGQILERQGLITAEQLNEALSEAEKTGQRLGETLVARGVLKQSDLSAALAAQENAQIGLLDALNDEPFDNCVAETGTPSLYILPIGGARAHDMSRMSPSTVRHVIDESRQRFDTILLDTGPVPGTIETSIVATEADEVVLVVTRGGNRSHANKAIQFLESVGATISGLVFNRAAPRDVARSMTATASLAPPNEESPEDETDDHGGGEGDGSSPRPRPKNYDPVAQAVARTSNPPRDRP